MSGIEEYVGENFFTNVEKAIKEVRDENQLVVEIEKARFVEEMLPHFAAEEQDELFYSSWVSFVGGVDVTTHIVDNGEVVLTIPPLFAGLSLAHNGKTAPPSEVFQKYKTIAPINAGAAMDGLLGNLDRWANNDSLVSSYKEMLQWHVMLSENGYEGFDLTTMESLLTDDELKSIGVTRGQYSINTQQQSKVGEGRYPEEKLSVDDGYDW